MRMRPTPLACLLAALALVATACGGTSGKDAGGVPTSEGGLTKVTMVQDWPCRGSAGSPGSWPTRRASSRTRASSSTWKCPPTSRTPSSCSPPTAPTWASRRSLDVVLARDAGASLTAVGAYVQSNNWGLIFREGDKADIKSLKGKKIGIYDDAWTKAQLAFMLGSENMALTDVKLVPDPNDTAPLLLAKKVDATTGVTNAEQAEVDTVGKQKSTMVLGKDHGVPEHLRLGARGARRLRRGAAREGGGVHARRREGHAVLDQEPRRGRPDLPRQVSRRRRPGLREGRLGRHRADPAEQDDEEARPALERHGVRGRA